MSLQVVLSGTQLAVIGTEHTVAAPIVSASYVFAVDVNELDTGDRVELRMYRKVLSTGVIRVAYFDFFVGPASIDDEVMVSVPIPCPYGGNFTIKQTSGTGRNFDWSLESL